jgi:DNA-binding MarR family transcriptional regulator
MTGSTTPQGRPSLTQIVGRAEQAFGALMRQVLSETGGTFHQWVCLSVLAGSGGTAAGSRLYDKVTGALKIDRALAVAAVEELAANGYVSGVGEADEVSLTDAGRRRFDALRSAIDAATSSLYEGVSEEDLAVTSKVLEAVTARANALLAKA